MKSEPDVYGIHHLAEEQTTLWDGIRNYQARNFMRSMDVGDQAFFYHSNCKPPGIVGLMEVVDRWNKRLCPWSNEINSEILKY